MEAQILNPLDGPVWDEMIAAHPQAGFFHSAAWARVLARTYGHRPFYLRFVRRQETAALLPMMEVNSALTGRRGVCLPFTDLCGPLTFGAADADAASEQHETLCRLGRERGWRHFEVRGREATPADAAPSTAFYGHSLDLRSGASGLFARFAAPLRRAIRKAESGPLRPSIVSTGEAMRDFYRLHVQTRRRHGVPPQPFAFFLNIWKEVIQPGLGFIALATHGAQAVAAAVFFCRAGKAVYKFGASDTAHQELRSNNLVMWSAIQELCDRGANSLHFGRTSLHHEGLRRFKLAWGACEERLEYFRFDLSRMAWRTCRDRVSGFHNAIFRRLPSALNRLAGFVLYPHLD